MDAAEKVARKRCRHCTCLIDREGEWACDESNKLCRDTNTCPEGMGELTEMLHNKGTKGA